MFPFVVPSQASFGGVYPGEQHFWGGFFCNSLVRGTADKPRTRKIADRLCLVVCGAESLDSLYTSVRGFFQHVSDVLSAITLSAIIASERDGRPMRAVLLQFAGEHTGTWFKTRNTPANNIWRYRRNGGNIRLMITLTPCTTSRVLPQSENTESRRHGTRGKYIIIVEGIVRFGSARRV